MFPVKDVVERDIEYRSDLERISKEKKRDKLADLSMT